MFQISTETLGRDPAQRDPSALEQRYDTRTVRLRAIGPTFGETVARSALIAIIASLLLIMAYVAFRFEPKFAIPVMIALFHDLLITAASTRSPAGR